MDASFVDMLLRYDWPGNVRELFNTVEQAFVMAGGESVVYARHLPAAVRIRVTRSRIQERAAVEEAPTSGWAEGLPSLKEWKRRAERDYLVRLLEAHGRDIGRLQAVSGLSRSHLYAVLKKHGLDLPPA
jgi:two-component system NtrC family response regulator